MIRGLIADVPTQTRVDLKRVMMESGPAMDIEVAVRDDSFLPVDQAQVRLVVTHLKVASDDLEPLTDSTDEGRARSIELTAEPSLREAGLYQAQFVPREEGAYHLAVEVSDSNGNLLAQEEAGWTNDPSADEFQSLQPHREWLELVAQQTGGRVLEKADLDAWAQQLEFEAAPVMHAVITPIWHTPYLFALAVTLLLLEWYLRRKGGLA
jgi:hypothetical protein